MQSREVGLGMFQWPLQTTAILRFCEFREQQPSWLYFWAIAPFAFMWFYASFKHTEQYLPTSAEISFKSIFHSCVEGTKDINAGAWHPRWKGSVLKRQYKGKRSHYKILDYDIETKNINPGHTIAIFFLLWSFISSEISLNYRGA